MWGVNDERVKSFNIVQYRPISYNDPSNEGLLRDSNICNKDVQQKK